MQLYTMINTKITKKSLFNKSDKFLVNFKNKNYSIIFTKKIKLITKLRWDNELCR